MNSIQTLSSVSSRLPGSRQLRSFRRTIHSIPCPNIDYVDARKAPSDFCQESAIVFENVISEEEGFTLLKDISTRMKRRRYERAHWDSVITGYKEIELAHPLDMQVVENMRNLSIEEGGVGAISETSIKIITSIRTILQNRFFADKLSSLRWLPCHAIELKKDGVLSAHVDSVKFSGDIVAGLSLSSSSIMRLKPDKDSYDTDSQPPSMEAYVDLLLPPLSLYVLSGVSRYQYTHELLPSGTLFSPNEAQEAIEVERDQRFSLIFRDAK